MKNEKLKMQHVVGSAALLLLIVLLAIVGCEEDNPVVPPRPPWTLVRIIAEDTLRYVPGDSATTPVFIIVMSRDGNVLPGRVVSYGLDSVRLGFLQPIEPARGDTTDDLGRLQLLFSSFGEPGMVRIFAECERVSALDSILILEYAAAPDSCIFRLEPDSIHYLYSDSVWVTMRFPVLNGIGLPNVQLHISVTGGVIYPPPATDSSGCATFLWQLFHQTGCYYIEIPVEPTLTDSVWVEP